MPRGSWGAVRYPRVLPSTSTRGLRDSGRRTGADVLGSRRNRFERRGGAVHHRAGMGRALLEEPAAREALLQCDSALRRYADWSLMEALTVDTSKARLDQTEIAREERSSAHCRSEVQAVRQREQP